MERSISNVEKGIVQRLRQTHGFERDGFLEKTMKLRAVSILLSFLFVACLAAGHGDQKHVIGTIEKMSADSVTVKTAVGGLVEVKLVPSTIYVSVGADKVAKPAKLADLHVGNRVVIHATPKPDNTLEAAEVRFSVAAPAAASTKSN